MLLTRKKHPALLLFFVSLICLALSAPSIAQDWHHKDHNGPPMEHSFHGGHGRWWDNPHLAQKIGLSDAQQKRMDKIFEQHRLQLVDLDATLKKDEIILHPLLQADQLDEQKILHQIDVIAQARANLEKANARMLFGLRKVLTPEQWKKLQVVAQEWHMRRHHENWRHGPGHPDFPKPPTGPDAKGGQPTPPPDRLPAQPQSEPGQSGTRQPPPPKTQQQ